MKTLLPYKWVPLYAVVITSFLTPPLNIKAAASDKPSTSKTTISQTVVIANQEPGNTAGQQIQAAIAALPQGGVVDARGYTGDQNIIDVPLKIGGYGHAPINLLIGTATFTVKQPILVETQSSIEGSPVGMAVGDLVRPSRATFIASKGANLGAVIQLGDGTDPNSGFGATLQDLIIDGNYTEDGTLSDGADILITNQAYRVDLTRVTAQNSAGYGIHFTGNGPQTSNTDASKLAKVMAIANQLDGLNALYTNDIFVSESEFENNGRDGIQLNYSAAMRIVNSDISGNRFGIAVYGETKQPSGSLDGGYHNITGNQFAANHENDLVIYGATHCIIAHNCFLGSGYRDKPNAYDAIHIGSSKGNIVNGNYIETSGSNNNQPANLWSAIHIYSDRTETDHAVNIVTNNYIDGPLSQAQALQLLDTTVANTNVVEQN